MMRRFRRADRRHRGGTSPTAADPIARPAAARTVELAHASTRAGSRAENGYGNDAPMEITERFPQPLGNLAQNARFPHFHSRPSVSFRTRKEQHTKNDGSDPSSDQPAAGESHPRPHATSARILSPTGTRR